MRNYRTLLSSINLLYNVHILTRIHTLQHTACNYRLLIAMIVLHLRTQRLSDTKLMGRSYHWGLKGPLPLNLSVSPPPQKFWEINSVKTLKCKKDGVKLRGLRPRTPFIY